MKQIIKKLAIVLSVALVCAPMGAMAANKLIVKDATGIIDKMVVTDAGKIGINISNPSYQLHIVGTGDPSTAAFLASAPGRATGFLATDSAGFSFMRNNAVSVNAGLPRANDRLGYIGFGTNLNGSNAWLGMIQSFSEANMTTSSAPTYLTFGVSATLGSVERMRITSVGNLGIGTTTPTQKLELNGGLRLNTSTTQPGCSSTTRGVVWFKQAAAGAADTLQVCAKDASEVYAWKNLF